MLICPRPNPTRFRVKRPLAPPPHVAFAGLLFIALKSSLTVKHKSGPDRILSYQASPIRGRYATYGNSMGDVKRNPKGYSADQESKSLECLPTLCACGTRKVKLFGRCNWPRRRSMSHLNTVCPPTPFYSAPVQKRRVIKISLVQLGNRT